MRILHLWYFCQLITAATAKASCFICIYLFIYTLKLEALHKLGEDRRKKRVQRYRHYQFNPIQSKYAFQANINKKKNRKNNHSWPPLQNIPVNKNIW